MKKAIVIILITAAVAALIAVLATVSSKMTDYCEENKPCSVNIRKWWRVLRDRGEE